MSPVRLSEQDTALSRLKGGFDPRTGHEGAREDMTPRQAAIELLQRMRLIPSEQRVQQIALIVEIQRAQRAFAKGV